LINIYQDQKDLIWAETHFGGEPRVLLYTVSIAAGLRLYPVESVVNVEEEIDLKVATVGQSNFLICDVGKIDLLSLLSSKLDQLRLTYLSSQSPDRNLIASVDLLSFTLRFLEDFE